MSARTRSRGEPGFTLIEVLICVVLLTMITGAITAALISSLHQSASTTDHVNQSSGAQVIAGWLTRDAQAAGGIDPATGIANPLLGVSQPSGAFTNGCAATGTPVVGFRWNDLSTSPPAIHVANYSYNSSTKELIRTSCIGATLPGIQTHLTLADDIISAPTIWCDGNTGSQCVAFPNTVNMTVSQAGTTNGVSPYTFTLTATVRSQQSAQPDSSRPAPLVLLGSGGSCATGATGLDVENSSSVTVYGQTYINAANSGACNAMNLDGGLLGFLFPTYYHAATTSIIAGGSCNASGLTSPCPTTTPYGSALADPYASLTPPTTGPNQNASTQCQGTNGTAQFGVYAAKLTVSGGTCTLASGVYILKNGISVANGASLKSAAGGVLLYISGGSFTATGTSITLSAMQTGPAPGVVVWQDRTDNNTVSLGNFSVFSLTGAIYAPGAGVNNSNLSATLSVAGIVAETLSVQNFAAMSIGTGPATPLNITTTSIPPWTINRPYNTAIAATGGQGAYTWSATGLTGTMTIDPMTGVISGMTNATGNSTIGVSVTDVLGDIDNQSFTLTMNPTPSITSTSLLGGDKGSVYNPNNTPLNGAGGTTPYTWAAPALTPLGLTINAGTGVITGTPNATGTSTIAVTLTDHAGATVTKNLSLTINAALAITTSTLPGGQRGVAYTAPALTGTGGTPPYTWAAAPLPNGLHITNGVISGTPTGNLGTTNVTITLTDSVGGTTTTVLPITITAAPTATVVSANPNAIGQGAANKTITITGTNFLAGAAVAISGNGITFNGGTTFVNATTLTVNLNISATALIGARTVTVTNGDGQAATGSAALTINTGPKITLINPNSRPRNTNNVTVTISGTGFVNGAVVTFVNGTGAPAITTTWNSAVQLTIKFNLGNTRTDWDVVVTNPDGGTSTVANGFTATN